MKPLIIPTVNLNGTSKDELIRQLLKVTLALGNVLTVMGEAMPHGRDYLPSPLDGERKDSQAREAWRERMQVLKDLSDEVTRHAFAVNDGHDRNAAFAVGRLWQPGNDSDDHEDEPRLGDHVTGELSEDYPSHEDIRHGGYPDVTTEEEDNEERLIARIGDNS